MMKIYYALNYESSRDESRRLLGEALARYTAESGSDPTCRMLEEIQTTEKGKPFLPGGPDFSISHTGQYWAVLMDDRPCT